MLYIYLITAILYGVFAYHMQRHYIPESTVKKSIFAGIVNGIFMPISLLIAIIEKDKWMPYEESDTEDIPPENGC